MNSLSLCSATTLASRIRTGKVSSLQAVDAHIKQVVKVNPQLNAMVEERFDSARKEARAADARLKSEGPANLPPLWGVPCSIKECFAVAGMRNTSGLWARRDFVADTDAVAVERLRAAGAIVMYTTNVSELCMWMETANSIYGRTSNPYDTSRTVGGSSGGEAALVASGAAPFGLGSDVGGSIRMPAFFNGIFGHKPTGGLVPNTGQFPDASGPARKYLSTGPICRRSEDLMPLLRILAKRGPTGNDALPHALDDPATVDLGNLKVIVVQDNGRMPVSDDVKDGLERAARALARSGADVRRMKIARLKYSLEIWSALMHAAGGPTFSELMGQGNAVNPVTELARFATTGSNHTFPAIMLGLLESLGDYMPGYQKRFAKEGERLKQDLAHLLGSNTVILYPPYTSAAPRHGKALMPPFNWVYTAIFNVMELPVTQVPVGLNSQGLPVGVQVVGPHGHDYLPIAVARELERACGGWMPPPMAL